MRRILFAFFILVVSIGCTLMPKVEHVQRSENLLEVYSPASSDSLQKEITDKNIIIDSLYILLEESDFTIDSLYQALEVANSRVAVNQDFIIPDSIIFAGRTFDLTNERIFDKFETIYKQII